MLEIFLLYLSKIDYAIFVLGSLQSFISIEKGALRSKDISKNGVAPVSLHYAVAFAAEEQFDSVQITAFCSEQKVDLSNFCLFLAK